MEEKQFITILGLGNILMKDEGFGVHFVRWIELGMFVKARKSFQSALKVEKKAR